MSERRPPYRLGYERFPARGPDSTFVRDNGPPPVPWLEYVELEVWSDGSLRDPMWGLVISRESWDEERERLGCARRALEALRRYAAPILAEEFSRTWREP